MSSDCHVSDEYQVIWVLMSLSNDVYQAEEYSKVLLKYHIYTYDEVIWTNHTSYSKMSEILKMVDI